MTTICVADILQIAQAPRKRRLSLRPNRQRRPPGQPRAFLAMSVSRPIPCELALVTKLARTAWAM